MKPLLVDDADADDVVSRRRLSELEGVKLTPLMPTLSLISSPAASSFSVRENSAVAEAAAVVGRRHSACLVYCGLRRACALSSMLHPLLSLSHHFSLT